MRIIHCAIALFVSAGSRAAQSGAFCPIIVIDGVVQQPNTGPGEAFGVTAYQCASCSFRRDKDKLAEYSFSAEPIVLEITSWSSLRAGDVIEAVNGQPITTRAGADQFTYPRAGESIVSVRRSGTRVELRATARAECSDVSKLDPGSVARIDVLKGAAAENFYGPRAAGGVIHIYRKQRYDSLYVIGAQPLTIGPDSKASPTNSRYGFAISCLPSCTRTTASDGTAYYKFAAHPPIAGIGAGGPAAMMGLRVGDVVTETTGFDTHGGRSFALSAIRAQRIAPRHDYARRQEGSAICCRLVSV